jgi:hypothetical protein
MKEKKDFSTIWIPLLSIVAILFFIIGVARIIFDSAIFNGIQYVITSVVFGVLAFLIKQNRVRPNFINPLFSLGFIFSIIGLVGNTGLSMYIGIWILGISFFLWGIVAKRE